MKVLFSSDPAQTALWAPELKRRASDEGVAFELFTEDDDVPREEVDVLVLNPITGAKDLKPYAGAKLIQSIWAGVESYLANPTLPDAPPLCRMVEPGLTEGMTDYIVGHVMRHHIGLDKHIRDTANGVWDPTIPPLSRDRTVAVLGLGALGADAAKMLAALRFNVVGWSRSQKSIEGVTCLSGPDGLREALSRGEIIVTIMPLTDDTRHVLDAETLALTPKGAAIINPGRGPLIDDDALLAALASGQIGHATLDVFNEEPLPEAHPFWRHPNVTVTPHIAAETRLSGAAQVVIEQIARLQRGEPLWHIVDRSLGY
ncbi:MAG: glyoxylate/hydroxypyruvate reductase A [Pseudomonadota bacterium]